MIAPPRRSLMLRPAGLGVPDSPPEVFRYGHPNNAAMARTFEPFIALGLPDECAWAALFTDAQRLDVFRATYGNRARPRGIPRARAVPGCLQLELDEAR